MAKPKAQFRRPSVSEQLGIEHCQLRLLSEPGDLARCDALIVEHHYLESATLVGEHLRYAATYKGEWLAVVSFSAAAYHRVASASVRNSAAGVCYDGRR